MAPPCGTGGHSDSGAFSVTTPDLGSYRVGQRSDFKKLSVCWVDGSSLP